MNILGEFPDKKLETLQFGIIIIYTCIDQRILKWRFFKKLRVVNSIEN